MPSVRQKILKHKQSQDALNAQSQKWKLATELLRDGKFSYFQLDNMTGGARALKCTHDTSTHITTAIAVYFAGRILPHFFIISGKRILSDWGTPVRVKFRHPPQGINYDSLELNGFLQMSVYWRLQRMSICNLPLSLCFYSTWARSRESMYLEMIIKC